MKKILLSGFVVVVFIGYVIHDRTEASGSQSRLLSSPPLPTPQPAFGSLKNGTYTGGVADAFYGNVQVQAVIKGGKLADINVLQYPNDRRTSEEINGRAIPLLKSEAIAAQDYQVDVVSGATQTSEAFIQSLKSALGQARI